MLGLLIKQKGFLPQTAEINEIMKNRLILLTAVLGAMALSFACGGAATNNANTAANKPASNAGVVVNGSGSSNISVTPVGNTANTPSFTANSGNKAVNLANSKDAAKANANKDTKPPKGANYLCRDGSYSMSNSDSGACSGHNGVQKPLNDKPQ